MKKKIIPEINHDHSWTYHGYTMPVSKQFVLKRSCGECHVTQEYDKSMKLDEKLWATQYYTFSRINHSVC